MRKIIALIAFLVPVQASAICTFTGGNINLEIPRLSDGPTVWTACIQRNFIVLSTSVLVGGTTSQFAEIIVSTINPNAGDFFVFFSTSIKIAGVGDFTNGILENGSSTLSNDISGNAATASSSTVSGTANALAGDPLAVCPAGQAAAGIVSTGGATGCFTPASIGETNTFGPSSKTFTGAVSIEALLTAESAEISLDLLVLGNQTINGLMLIDSNIGPTLELKSTSPRILFTDTDNNNGQLEVNGDVMSVGSISNLNRMQIRLSDGHVSILTILANPRADTIFEVEGDGSLYSMVVSSPGMPARLFVVMGIGLVGIGTDSPQTKLEIEGDFSWGLGIKKSSGSATGGLTLVDQFDLKSSTWTWDGVKYLAPPADGANGQLLTTDGSGNLDWTTSAGGGDALLAADQTWTGENIYEGDTIFTGAVSFSSTTPPSVGSTSNPQGGATSVIPMKSIDGGFLPAGCPVAVVFASTGPFEFAQFTSTTSIPPISRQLMGITMQESNPGDIIDIGLEGIFRVENSTDAIGSAEHVGFTTGARCRVGRATSPAVAKSLVRGTIPAFAKFWIWLGGTQ